VRRPAKIAQHYVKTWFAIDLCSSVPIDQIVTVASGSSSSALRLNKMIRLVRMVKLLRIARLMRLKNSEIGAPPDPNLLLLLLPPQLPPPPPPAAAAPPPEHASPASQATRSRT
jgi:hypothetical protein